MRSLIIGLSTAKEVWKCLEERYANASKERAQDLTHRLRQVKRNDFSTLDEYLQKVKTICTELAAIQQAVDDQDKLHWALIGLGEKYDTFVIAMQVCSPLWLYLLLKSLLTSYLYMKNIIGIM